MYDMLNQRTEAVLRAKGGPTQYLYGVPKGVYIQCLVSSQSANAFSACQNQQELQDNCKLPY